MAPPAASLSQENHPWQFRQAGLPPSGKPCSGNLPPRPRSAQGPGGDAAHLRRLRLGRGSGCLDVTRSNSRFSLKKASRELALDKAAELRQKQLAGLKKEEKVCTEFTPEALLALARRLPGNPAGKGASTPNLKAQSHQSNGLVRPARQSSAHLGAASNDSDQDDEDFMQHTTATPNEQADAGDLSKTDSRDVLRRSSSSGSVASKRSSQLDVRLVGGRYRTVKFLGKGTSASVWEGVDDSNGQRCAIKIFDKQKGNWATRQKQVWREAKLLELLAHPSIVKIQSTFDTGNKFYLLLELVVGGSLRELITQQPTAGLGEEQSRHLFEQISSGLSFCHGHNVVHRDVKLENILVEASTKSAKIIDFGFALRLRSAEQQLKIFCGTPSYMAPELVMGKEYSGFCTDVWALGVVLFGMLAGRLPFEGKTESQLYAKIRRGGYRIPDIVPELPRRVIAGILRIDERSRPAASQILQHRWIRQEDGDDDSPARPSSVPACVRRMRASQSGAGHQEGTNSFGHL